ncbi:MAG: RlmE family RNA methyltransferase, partial [Gammaproteobacteria bacterium]
RQQRDPYVKSAVAARLGSRAHFKLEQLDRRFSLLRPQMAVLELGAAPGGWTRYLARRVTDGLIVAVDNKPMPVPNGVVFACIDIYSEGFEQAVAELIGARRLDLVLSDMAPNISGVTVADQAATMGLVELATQCAMRWLKQGGALVVKMFQGEGVDQWVAGARGSFAKVVLAKPAASRTQSREVYGVATGFTGSLRLKDLVR